MRITVLGAGAWGTTLAKIAHEAGHEITLWGRPERLAGLAYKKENSEYLPCIALPDSWRLEADWEKALDQSQAVIVAVPSASFRSVAAGLDGFDGIAVTVTKGIEHATGLTMGGILNQTAPEADVVALSGPSLAAEVARNIPTAMVAGSESELAAACVQEWFHRPTLRVYTSTDVLGVELGGAVELRLRVFFAPQLEVRVGELRLRLGRGAHDGLAGRGIAQRANDGFPLVHKSDGYTEFRDAESELSSPVEGIDDPAAIIIHAAWVVNGPLREDCVFWESFGDELDKHVV